MKKKVLIFSLNYRPFIGGAEVALEEITTRLQGTYEFHVVTLRYDSNLPKEEDLGGVEVHRIGFGGKGMTAAKSFHPLFYLSKILFVPLAAYCGWKLHRKHEFSVFWAMMAYMVFPITLLRLVGTRVPYMITLQEGDPFEHVFSRPLIIPFRPLLSYGFSRAGALQAISEYLLVWGEKLGFKGKGVVIPNGVDSALFSTPIIEEERSRIRSRYAADDETLLVTTSRLVHKNGIDTVIEALPELPKVKFLVIGEGPDKEKLEGLSRKLGVAERVIFLGSKPYRELPQYLQSSDIFIRPSRSEGMGNSFIEAMAAGIPVIATQEGGIKDFLFDAKRNPEREATGFAVTKESPTEIVEAVGRVLGNKEDTKRVVENARTLVQETYDWERVSTSMRALFSTLS